MKQQVCKKTTRSSLFIFRSSLFALRSSSSALRPSLFALIAVILLCAVVAEGAETKPWFSLSSYRTYRPGEDVQVYLTYQDVEEMEFRVYRVHDPIKFFEGLPELHAFGPSTRPPHKKSRIEALHALKQNTFEKIRNYFRTQLSFNTRKTVLQTLSSPAARRRAPIKGAQFAVLPVLNQAQLVESWHETLPPARASESYYKPLTVSLDLKQQGVYLVEAVNGERRAYAVLIITNLALVTKSAPGYMLVLAVDRNNGKPQEHCDVHVYSNRQPVGSGRTDASGIYSITKEGLEDALVLARTGADFAVSDLQRYYFQESDSLKSYIYTDRPVYRPGHKVYFKGILRSFSGGQYSLKLPDSLEVEVRDAENKPIYTENLRVSEYGTFDGALTTTETAGLGFYSIIAHVGDQQVRGSFRVEEYKKPEYEVKVTTDKKMYVQGETIVAEISARYYFGEPVANAKLQYQVYASRYYRWVDEEDEENAYPEDTGEGEDDPLSRSYDNRQLSEAEGMLDANGKLTVRIPTQAEDKGADLNYRIVARVTDAARREISGSATALVTRGEFNIGITTDKYVYQPRETAHLSIRTLTFEGKPVSASVDLEFDRVIWSKRNREERLVSRGSVQTDANGKGTYDLAVGESGYFTMKASARDGSGHTITADHYLYVSGEGFDEYYGYESRQVELIPDKKTYRVGDVAHVLILAPVSDIHMLAALEGRQVHRYWPMPIAGRSVTLDVPIQRDYALNCFVNVTFVKAGQLYTRTKRLNVAMDDYFLDVTVAANKSEYKPQEQGEFAITVKDHQGNPIRAELSVGVVDESVYAIRPEAVPDLRKAFYVAGRWNRVYTQFSAAYNFTGYSATQAMQLATLKQRQVYLADFKASGRMAEAKVRKLFPDTLLWNAHLVTDSGGRARVAVPYPDSLTTWRTTVRAVTRDSKVGSAVAKTITRKNLILRLEAPRFFTERDEATVSTIVHNYLTSDKTAKVSLTIKGAELLDGAEKSLTVPSRGESRVDWRVKASTIGDVTLLGKALTDEESDAVEVMLPTVPYGLGVTIGRSGQNTQEAATIVEKIALPANANLRANSLRINLAPSLVSTIIGALDYLTSYPYGCVEQTMSSFLPNVIVTKTVQELGLAEVKNARDLPIKVRKGLDRLYRYQHRDGGWGWWETDESNPFMTAYVIAGLADAKSAGYDVDAGVIQRGRSSLAEQLKSTDAKITPDVRSYMIYALAASGGVDGALIDAAYNARKDVNNFGLALLTLALALQDKPRAITVADDLEKKGTATDGECYWASKRQPMLDFYEDNTLEATAFAVKALSLLKPQSPLIGKGVRWLVAHRKFGYYWDSTKQTALVIYGLIQYLKMTKELEPDYRVQVFFNNTLIKEQPITPREAQNPTGITIAVGSEQLRRGDNEIKIVKNGHGNLYYSLAAKYYTTDEKIPAQGSEQLKVERSYFRLRPEKQTERVVYNEEPITGPVVSGDTILVRLKISGKNAQYMLIEDPIPAGCEPIEQDQVYELGGSHGRMWRSYDRRELRDQKVVFFRTYFYRGDQELYYVLKAQAPGTYNAMPTQIELMYQPEYRANSENYVLRVNDK